MKQRYSLKSNAVKFRLLTLTLLALLGLGGKSAFAGNWPTATGNNPTTLSVSKTYYVYSATSTTDENTGNGAGTYKFYLLESEVDPATYNFGSATKYEYFSACIINGGKSNEPNGSGIHIKFVFNTSKPVGFMGFFCVSDGILEMELGQYYSNTLGITLKRTGNWGSYSDSNINCPFTIPDVDRTVGSYTSGIDFNYNTNEKSLDAQKIIITGNPPLVDNPENDTCTFSNTRQFVIDGGHNPTVTYNDADSTSYTVSIPSTQTGGKTTFFRVMCGTLQLTNVTLQNHYVNGSGNTGGIYVITNSTGTSSGDRKSAVKLEMEHCWLHHLANTMPGVYLQYGTRIMSFSGSSKPSATLSRCKFTDNYSTSRNNAAIRSFSNGWCDLTMDRCTVFNNLGGGVRWQSTRPCIATFNNCLIKRNRTYGNSTSDPAQGSGGGLLIKSSSIINGCLVEKNWAQRSGGGIYFTTFEEGGNATGYQPVHGNLEFDVDPDKGTTVIQNNRACENGGGVAVMAHKMLVSPYYYGYTDGVQDGQYKMTFTLNGATIQNNTALSGDGGGVYISRGADATFYGLTCNLNKGIIRNNVAENGNGGGVCITQAQNPTGNPFGLPTSSSNLNENYNIKPLDVTITLSMMGAEKEMLIENNVKCKNGGGMYVDVPEINYHTYNLNYQDVTARTFITVYDYANIYNNTASISGGGLYLKKGTVTIIQEGNDHRPTIQKNTATSGDGGGVYLYDGNITLDNATIGGSTETLGNSAGSSGGGIYVHSGTVTMLSTLIQHNKANSGSGGGLYVGGGDVFINPNEIGTGIRSKISDNEAGFDGGGVYTGNGKLIAYGSFSESGAQSNHIEITNNKALAGNGGGIYCQGTSTSQSWEYDIRLRRVDIGNNYAKESGGGVYLYEGKISVIDGAINGNTADKNGGGVYTQKGNIDINATRDERFSSEIINNTAGINGGGLNTHEGYIRIFGTSKEQRIPIANNKATNGSGGGIFCMGEGTENQYITMQHADLINNRAVNGTGTTNSDGVVYGCGGGMYLQKGKISITDVNLQNNYAKHNGGGINNHEGSIDVDGCFIGSSHSDGGEYYYKDELTYSTDPTVTNDTDRGNEAGNNGGGIYTHKGDIDIEDYVLTSGNIFREESKITFNKAGNNGGGVNTHMGTISINTKEEDDQIEVAFNRANKGGGMYANAGTIIAYNALIHDNTATLNGGGANNHSGDIILHGGMLSNNTAETGHGGGAYTFVGDIDLFQFPRHKFNNVTLNDGTKIYNNIALKNGGAFNNHTGRIDVRHATLYNNTSTQGNGGAIFCEGPHANADKGLGYTIRLLNSMMVQNKTRGQDGTATDPTGRGGGIYLKYGSIYAHNSSILNNEASIAGGGLDNHEGNILLYGCDIIGNIAHELNGGGIFTLYGDITTGPSSERVDDPTYSMATVIQKNQAHKNGGGIYNQEGNINLNGDRIGGSEADANIAEKGDGGGIYIAKGHINMQGGKIAYNEAVNGKGGGVYSGGGDFLIEKRPNNPEPIVIIVDVKVERDGNEQKAIVHYHLVDQGKLTSDGAANVKHGIMWGEGNTNTTVVYGNTEYDPPYGYRVEEVGCQRITIPATLISDNTTYNVKAFYQYDCGSPAETVIGYSESMDFITYSNSYPTVLSGAMSNITSTSATGSGKIMDNGGHDIKKKGVQIWTGTAGNPPVNNVNNLPENLYPSSDDTEFFTVDVSNLSPDVTYYARAYATYKSEPASVADYAFGNTVEFKTLKATPNMGNGPLTVSAAINEDGIIVVTASYTMPTGTTFGEGPNDVKGYGFVWSTDDDPELYTDNTVKGTLQGENSTTFFAEYPDAVEGTCFYVRAYATYAESEVTSNSDVTDYSISVPKPVYTPYLNGTPVVRAIEISNITQNSATVTCQIYSGYVSGTTTTKYGVYVDNLVNNNVPENDPDYGTHRFPSSNFVPQSTTPPNNDKGTYSVTLTGLTPGTTYYLKAYATNDGTNYSYGNNFNFTALPISRPNVMVTAINYYFDPDDPEQTDHSKVDVVCKIVSDGGAGITACGINYGDFQLNDQNQLVPVPAEHSPIQGNVSSISNGKFTITIMNLTPHKDYWVNAYVTNEANLTHTCQSVNFTSNYDKPSVELDNINNLVSVEGTETNPPTLTGTGNYTVTLAGTTPVRTHGVCWSTFHNPKRTHSDVANTHFQDGTGTINESGSSSATMNQRFPNMKYYARAYASTATPNDVIYPSNPANNTYALADIVYCEQERAFLTLPLMQSNGVSNINSTSATLAGTIASRDPEHNLIKYGVCWGMNANPTPIKDPTDPNYDSEHPNYLEVDITSASSTSRPFSINVTGLADPEQPNVPQTYHYRAYAINRNGTSGTGYDFTAAQTNIAYGPDVEFQTTPYTITATANPASAGSVAYTSGLTSGGGWDGNSSFTLTAQANENWQFKDWTRNDVTTNLTDNPLTQTSAQAGGVGNHTYLANFQARVSVAANGTGSVSFTYPEGGTEVYTEAYIDLNTRVTVTATSESASFLYWTDAAGQIILGDDGEPLEEATYRFDLSAPVSLTAHFSVRNIFVSAIPAEGGDVSTVSGNDTYNNGESCTVSATANDGYVFLYWKEGDNVVSTDAYYTFYVSSDRTLTAYFGRTIAVSANNDDYGTVTGAGAYLIGETCTVTATANTDYTFIYWKEGDNVVSTDATYAFTVSGNRTLEANFEPSKGRGASRPSRPRDIYPAPAREPWDWDNDPLREGELAVTTNTTVTISALTATIKGTVTNWGTGGVNQAAGIWYSSSNPEYASGNNPGTFVQCSPTPAPDANVEFTVNLYGLTVNQNYYARAYATNNGTDYVFGEAVTIRIKTPSVTTGTVSIVDVNKAKCTGSQITAIGSSNVTTYGICWNTSPNPTIELPTKTIVTVSDPSSTQNPPINIGEQDMTDLTGGTTYYVRAYATNSQGTAYGNEIILTTTVPSIATGPANIINYTTATCAVVVYHEGNQAITEKGVCVGTTIDPAINGEGVIKVAATGNGTGTFLCNFTEQLAAQVIYYARAYATNDGGNNYIYGDNIVFRTSDPISIPSIDHNMAEKGGGIYVDYTKSVGNTKPTKLIFSGGEIDDPEKGQINYNYASEAGGGIYIADSGYMQMKGHCEVNANHVPEGKRGGGIYLDGRLYIGNNKNDIAGTHGLIVNRNFAMNNFSESDYDNNPADYAYNNKPNLNNVFLTRYESDFSLNWDAGHASHDDDATVITLLSDISGKNTEGKPYTNIGFHVLRGFCPVVATSENLWGQYTNTSLQLKPTYEQWLYNLMEGGSDDGNSGFDANGALFEDTDTYVAIHVRKHAGPPFLPKYIYLWGCWTYPAVNVDPEDLNPMTNSTSTAENFRGHYKIVDKTDGILTWEIYSEEGLSWFSSYVNGLNVFEAGDAQHAKYDPEKNPYAKATLMNDLDMSSHIWTPIGSVTTFNAGNLGNEQSTSTSADGALFTDDQNKPHHYKGSFDGQGHIIRGVNVRYVTGIYKYGLFGYLDEGASVKNVFVDESNFITDDPSKSYYVGGIAGLVTASDSKNIVISGSEARVEIDITSANKATSYVGGLVGNVADGATGEAAYNTVIHSSMAMPEVIGAVKYMGGLVGYLGSNDSLVNSFSNPKFNTAPESGNYIGGLVGENNGLVENCYTRLRGDEQPRFAYVAGTSNNNKIRYTYIPAGKTNYVGNGTDPTDHGTYTATQRYSGKYGFKHRDQQMTAADENATYISTALNDMLIVGGLNNTLNAWVIAKKTAKRPFESWTRTMASPINDDYPIPMLTTKGTNEKFNSVGSKDGIYLLYEDNINDMWSETGKNFQAVNGTPGNAAMFLYDVQPGTTPADVTITGNINVPLYIHEDIGITQGDGNSLTARVGVTFDNSNGSPLPELGGQPYDWHMFSSALKNVPMGLEYYDDGSNYPVQKDYSTLKTTGLLDNSDQYHSRAFMDPPRTTWYQSDDPEGKSYNKNGDKIGYFPTNTSYGTSAYNGTVGGPGNDGSSFDFYTFTEKHRHWINFKRKGVENFYDHWHLDAVPQSGNPTATWVHHNIAYKNETTMLRGKGYMMGVSEASMLMADGILNNGEEIESDELLTNSSYEFNQSGYSEELRGTNLVGNPYQSYLNFDLFAFGADAEHPSPNKGKIDGYSYYVFDADYGGYKTYTAGSSQNPVQATCYIHPHQGFFVKTAKESTTLIFDNTMRSATGNTESYFRNKLNYPLVNLFCYDSEGKRDVTTVEINRPDEGGGFKMKGLRKGKMLIYARWDNADYQTAFTPIGIREVPVRFQAFEDGVFTMRWGTLHGNFHYLHLIDNMTGADVDMLRSEEYRFEASSSDYLSRFKLVFEATGLEEEDDNEDDNGSSIVNFAFRMGDEIIVNGEGYFELFDLQGRCLTAKHLAGAQSSVSLPNVAAGVYLLRLTGDKQVKTQKMVISY